MAANAVAATNEILEQILKHLPMKEILYAREVSSHWKELVEFSFPLRQATFRDLPTTSVLAVHSQDAITCLNNYRLSYLDSSSTIPPLDTSSHTARAISSTFRPVHMVIVNPLISHKHWTRDDEGPFVYCFDVLGSLTHETPYKYRYMLVFNGLSGLSKIKSSIMSDMHISEPPCTALSLRVYIKAPAPYVCGLTLRDHEGITLGLLTEYFERMLLSIDMALLSERPRLVAAFRTRSNGP